MFDEKIITYAALFLTRFIERYFGNCVYEDPPQRT